MTGFEDTLAEILADEARRYEVPAFDAYAVADQASARPAGGFRRNRLALAAGLVTAAAVSAGAVFGLTGGGAGRTGPSDKPIGARVRLTFVVSGPAYSSAPDAYSQLMKVVRSRAAAAGFEDVSVDRQGDGVVVKATGPAADRAMVESLVQPGILTFRPVLDPADLGLVEPPGAQCATSQLTEVRAALAAKGLEFICDVGHSKALLVARSGAEVSGVSEVAGARAQPYVTSTGTPTDNWAVDLTLTPDGTKDFTDVTTEAFHTGGEFAVVVDGVSYLDSTVTGGPIVDGAAMISGPFTERQAKLLAAVVGDGTVPPGFKVETVETGDGAD